MPHTAEALAAPAAAPAAPLINLREQLDLALDSIPPKAKQWLLSLPDHNWQEWGAAEKLGFSSSSVHKWKRDPRIAYARQLLEEQAEADYGLTRRYFAQAYKRIAEADLRRTVDARGKPIPLHKLDDDTAYALSEVSGAGAKRRVKMHDKRFALEALQKLAGIGVVQRIEHTGADGAPLMPQAADPVDIAKRVAFLLQAGVATSEEKPTA